MASSKFRGVHHTTVPPAAALAWLTNALTASGASIISQSPLGVTGAYRHRGDINPAVAILLFLLCVVPFIIYLITQSRETMMTFSVTVQPWGTGSAVSFMADTRVAARIDMLIRQLPPLA